MRPSLLTESNAFLMSWNNIQHSLCCSFASSITFSITIIGCSVLPPGRPAQLLCARISVSFSIFSNLCVMILVKSFLGVSRRAISLRLLRSSSQSSFFGIGIMLLFFHALGTSDASMHRLKISVSVFFALSPICLYHSYVDSPLPGALLFGLVLITSSTSSLVISSTRVLYVSRSTFGVWLYLLAHLFVILRLSFPKILSLLFSWKYLATSSAISSGSVLIS